MRRVSMLSLLSLFAARAAADFPAPKDLPSRPELPDPLVMFDGTKVTTKEQWVEKRRPELKALFQHYMYGSIPPAGTVTAKVLARGPEGVRRQGDPARGQPVRPARPRVSLARRCAQRPQGPGRRASSARTSAATTLSSMTRRCAVPTAWMYPNRPGVKDDKATEEGRGKAERRLEPRSKSIERGYAVATFYNGEIDPDRADVRGPAFGPLAAEGPATRRTIACWAWGIHRAVDYLTTLKGEIDPKRLIAVGHSRLGKTALLAAAFDDRIAMAIPLQAGTGGSARAGRSARRPTRPRASSGSTPASRTGSTAGSRSSTTTRAGCRSTRTAWSPCAPRGRSCSPTRPRTCGRTRPGSSRS